MKRILSLIVAFVMAISLMSASASASSSDGLAEIAKNAVGKTYSDLNLPSSNWCGYFVGYCINNSTVSALAGEKISQADSMNPMTLINWACAKKGIGTYYSLSSTHYSRLVGKYQNLSIVATTANDFIPMPSDIIVFDWDGREDSKHVFSHVGIVTEEYNASSAKFTYVDGNSSTGNRTYVVKKTSNISNNSIIGYIRINGQSCTPAENTIIASIPEGTYTLVPQCAPNLRLDVAGASTENKTNIQIYQDNGTIAQQFEFASAGDGYYSITAKVSGKRLDVKEGKKVSGTNVWQYTPNSTDAQKWRLEDAGDGYYYIVPKLNTGLCLDVYSAKNENRTNVQVYNKNQTSAQKWTLIPLDTASMDTPTTTTLNSVGWGPWSEWSANYVAPSDTREVETQVVKVSDAYTEYRYGRYIDSTGAYVGWCGKYMADRYSTSVSIQYTNWSTTRYSDNGTKWTCGYCGGDHAHALYTSSDGRAFWARHVLPEGNFYWEESRVVDAQYETQYRYRDAEEKVRVVLDLGTLFN